MFYEVIYKEVNGVKMEPFENLIVDVPEEYVGSVIEKLASRKAQMVSMDAGLKRTNIDFTIPARGLIGFRSEFIRMTKGEGIMYHTFDRYDEYAGDIPRQRTGSLIAHEDGEAVAYALHQSSQFLCNIPVSFHTFLSSFLHSFHCQTGLRELRGRRPVIF